MKDKDGTLAWAMVEAQLPGGWQELAEEYGLVRPQPEQLGAKVDRIGDLLRIVFHHVATGNSLRATTARAAAAGILVMSCVALHKWMKKLGPYLAALLRGMVGAAAFRPERSSACSTKSGERGSMWPSACVWHPMAVWRVC